MGSSRVMNVVSIEGCVVSQMKKPFKLARQRRWLYLAASA